MLIEIKDNFQTEVQDCKEQVNILSNQIKSRFDELKRKIDLLL